MRINISIKNFALRHFISTVGRKRKSTLSNSEKQLGLGLVSINVANKGYNMPIGGLIIRKCCYNFCCYPEQEAKVICSDILVLKIILVIALVSFSAIILILFSFS